MLVTLSMMVYCCSRVVIRNSRNHREILLSASQTLEIWWTSFLSGFGGGSCSGQQRSGTPLARPHG